VDPDVRTALVTDGPFRWVRDPIVDASVATVVGLALIVPNALAAAMLGALLVAHDIQVRLVEEPNLRRVHGDAYLAYARRTGRFLPRVSSLRWAQGR